ncbi:acyl-CoA dehydrogenase C-terminal domain-containing protein [Marinobacter caseinilyticus]|uniref:acyl-CoA dehydrogenase C-terminal domain-containing protein n=1 Tax=Marinobacter caseinilyticus TaxID=2692195 RepID=UPI001F4402E8|nr:acyl-CoA dehydrogenase C-terminal domain-containing protein [Marinobacter caseinilyticus]
MREFTWTRSNVARRQLAHKNPAAGDFRMFGGYVTMACMWARMAAGAVNKLDWGDAEAAEFYQATLATAVFHNGRLLSGTQAHATCTLGPTRTPMQLAPEPFSSMD